MSMEPTTKWAPSLTMMNQFRIEQLHNAATKILREIGLNVHHPGMRAMLGGAGARLGEEARVYLPEKMVSHALEKVKKNVIIHNHHGEAVMPLGPN